MSGNATAVHGIYHDRRNAEDAISWMCSDGFHLSDISVLCRGESSDKAVRQDIEAKFASSDAVPGSPLSGSTGMGIGPFLCVGPIAKGDILISVDCSDLKAMTCAKDILRLTGAEGVTTTGRYAGAA